MSCNHLLHCLGTTSAHFCRVKKIKIFSYKWSIIVKFILSDSELKSRLQQAYDHFSELSEYFIGYQVNRNYDYSDLYRFFEFSINNVGDAFGTRESSYRTQTHNFEKDVIRFIAHLYGANTDSVWGYVSSGGTEANMLGLYLAREKYNNGIVYYSEDTHYSIPKILRMLKLDYKLIPSTKYGTIDLNLLEEALKSNNQPAILQLNISTTMKGATDPLDKIILLLKSLDITEYYIHCDATFGGMIFPFINNHPLQSVKNKINSISISGHKMIGCPMPSGIALSFDKNVDHISEDIQYINSVDNTVMGSRSGQATLFLWYSLYKNGIEGWKAIIKNCIEMSDYAVKELKQFGAWKNPNSLIIVINRPADWIVKKWQLAVEGDISHIVTTPNVSKKQIQLLKQDLSL